MCLSKQRMGCISPKMSNISLWCLHIFLYFLSLFFFSDLALRLADGGKNYGRLEVKYDNVWGTICNTSWIYVNAMVACKQLGFIDGVPYDTELLSSPSPANAPIYMDGVWCGPDDEKIWSCDSYGWKQVSASCKDHSKDVSVYCYFSGKF